MHITLSDGHNTFISLDVDPAETIENVKALLSAEINFPFERLQILVNGKKVSDDRRLNDFKTEDIGLLYFAAKQIKPQGLGIAASIKEFTKQKQGNDSQEQRPFSIANAVRAFDKQIKSIRDEGYEFKHHELELFKKEAKRVYQTVRNDPMKLSSVLANNPALGEAIRSDDIDRLAQMLFQSHEEKIRQLKAEERRFIELSRDPMNPEYQRLLQARIHQQNVEANLSYAEEYLPEVFGLVSMLYIKAKINKTSIQAFVDSGAQMTVMSVSLAERCNLMRLVDKRETGTAVGAGSCKIIGKIHAVDIEIQNKFVACSITVLDSNGVDFLLGLDMLKRYCCVIDLKNNLLNFQDGLIITHFLSDGQIQKKPHSLPAELMPKVDKLMAMGFTKEQATKALEETSFNEELAANLLMQWRFGK